jgi:hypothetical protein
VVRASGSSDGMSVGPVLYTGALARDKEKLDDDARNLD